MESNCASALVQEVAHPTMTEQTATRADRPVHVLLIEDDPEAAELARIRLTEDVYEPFRVDWRRTLLEGMGRLIEPGIDVVLLDLGLPELSGYKSYQAVALAAGDRVPIVILTADDRSISRDLVLEFGAADYLLKQESSSAQLRQALRNAVLRRRPDFARG
jgi:two-component system catabolic regulation response regulator CreB